MIIIGAGPAGSSAAITAAKLGIDVLLIDGKKFPRRKACGGCLNLVSTTLVETLLPAASELWLESIPLKKFQVFHHQRSFPMEMDNGGYAVDRATLDFALVNQAVSLGAEFLSPAKAKLIAAADQDPDVCSVEMVCAGKTETIKAKVVIIASGLGNRVAGEYQQFHQTPTKNSRVGVEALFESFPAAYQSGVLSMAIGDVGYVGLTHVGNDRLHVAAAVDRIALQELGPQKAVDRLMQQSGAPTLSQPDINDVVWRGTPPLTATAETISQNRVFLIGDAAGYVEPFTGEGIRWALESGIGVVPFVAAALDAYRPQIDVDYQRWYRRTILSQQRLCRRLSAGLKRPVVRWAAHQALRLRPTIADSIIKRLNS